MSKQYQGVKNFTLVIRRIILNSYEVRLNQTLKNLKNSKFWWRILCVIQDDQKHD